MNQLLDKIKSKDTCGFTHSGKFHADDVFASALLLYFNPELEIIRGNRVPENFEGIVYDIGRGEYDHHQKDSRVRENGVPYAAFGLLWEKLGAEILGEELAQKFDESFVQPLDNNDNTGERNELASLIGDFNPSWDEEGSNDDAFFEAVNLAGTILENKFSRFRGNERADQQIESFMQDAKHHILVMPQFVPGQKKLADTDIEFIIFPSNRGGYCVQPIRKEGSMNYKCDFPSEWLGLENDELQTETGLDSASFCHKGGFLLSVGELDDAIEACRMSQRKYVEVSTIVYYRQRGCKDEQIQKQIEQMQQKMNSETAIKVVHFPELPELSEEEMYATVSLEKEEWKDLNKKVLKKILKEKPEAVVVDGEPLLSYPMIHLLRKKRVPVLVAVEKDGKKQLVRIPSGS